MKFKCRMSIDLYFTLEAQDEEEAMDYLNTHTNEDVLRAYAKHGEVLYESYDDDITGIADKNEFAINVKE